MDDRDLADYFAGLGKAPVPEVHAGATQPATDLAATHPANSQAKTRQRAEAFLVWLRKRLPPESKLGLQVDVERLRTFEATVGQTFDVRHLALDASLEHGSFDAEYHASIYGGTVLQKAHANLFDQRRNCRPRRR